MMNTNCSGIIDDVKVMSGFDGIVMVAIANGTNSQWRIQNTRVIINGDTNFPSVQNRGIFLNHLTTTIQNCNITVNSPQATQVYGILVGASGITNNLTLSGNIFDVRGSAPTWLTCGSSHAVTTVRGLLDPSKVALNGSVINWDAGDGSGLTNIQAGNVVGLINGSALQASQYVATDGTTNLVSTQNGNSWTNTIAWTHLGTATNITATFNGTLQTFTCTNGPSNGQDYFIHYAGANGSVSYRFSGSGYNNLHFDYQPKWLAGSNSVITNGVLSLTSYGGTNATQIEAAMRENQ
jgi:hypothetical protein